MSEILDIAQKYKHRCDKSKIVCVSYWNRAIENKIKLND